MAVIETGRESGRDGEEPGISGDAAVVPTVGCLDLAQVMVVDSTSRWLGPPNSLSARLWKAESTASAPRISSRRHSTTMSERRANRAVPASSPTFTVWDTRDVMSSVSVFFRHEMHEREHRENVA